MIEHPFISIITPTFNSSSTIEACLLSVANQTYKNIEHLFIDGFSTDNTLQIIGKYQNEFSHIKVISEEDKGVYDAMNKGIKLSKGEWLYFLGSDDRLFPDSLDQIASFEIKNYSLIYGNVKRIPSNTIYDGEFDLKRLFYKNICHQAIFTRRILFDTLGFFNIDYKSRADYAFNIKVFSNGYKTKYFPITIAEFSDNGLCSRYFDIDFWKDYKDNYIRPFKGVISRKERYGILWKYYDHLLSINASLLKIIRIFIIITFNEFSLKNSAEAIKSLFSH